MAADLLNQGLVTKEPQAEELAPMDTVQKIVLETVTEAPKLENKRRNFQQKLTPAMERAKREFGILKKQKKSNSKERNLSFEVIDIFAINSTQLIATVNNFFPQFREKKNNKLLSESCFWGKIFCFCGDWPIPEP